MNKPILEAFGKWMEDFLSGRIRKFFPLLFLLMGLLLTYYPSILTRFDRMVGDSGDTRLNLYFLEHSYRFLRGETLHKSLWDSPMFYPEKLVALRSDLLIGSGGAYYLGRLAGLDEYKAFYLWTLVILSLNYLLVYILLRKGLYFEIFPSAAGAYLFSFCALRLTRLVVIQMSLQFYCILALFLLLLFRKSVLAEEKISFWKKILLPGGAALAMILQFYSAYYPGWLFGFVFTLFLCAALFFRECREELWKILSGNWLTLLLIALGMILALLPFIYYSMQIPERMPKETVFMALPTWATHFNCGSLLYSNYMDLSMPAAQDHMMGLGYMTSIAVIMGAILLWKSPNKWGRAGVIAVLAAILFTLQWKGFTLWHPFYHFFPGAFAIRLLSRITFALLFFYGIFFAFLLMRARFFWKYFIFAVLVAENFCIPYVRWSCREEKSRLAPLVKALEGEGKSKIPFVIVKEDRRGEFAPLADLDAIWVSLRLRRPTCNGATGVTPSAYKRMGYKETGSLLPKLGLPQIEVLTLAPDNRVLDRKILKYPESPPAPPSR